MKQSELIELMQAFEKSNLQEMLYDTADVKLRLRKPEVQVVAQAAPAAVVSAPAAPAVQEPAAAAAEENSFTKVKAPLVGTFYRAPGEGQKPFVELGDIVKEGDVLFILEAMKMFNEIKSPCSGIIKAIHGLNGELVEYDQVLVEIEEVNV